MAKPDCKVCGGSGWRIVERGGLSGAEPCECEIPERVQLIRSAAGLPPNLERMSFDTFNVTPSVDLAQLVFNLRAYVREFPPGNKPGLLIMGEPGTGKTHLAVSVLKLIMEKGNEGRFFDYANLLEEIRRSFDDVGEAAFGAPPALVRAKEATVALLDDVGAHRPKAFVEDVIAEILTHRCNLRQPTILTTSFLDPDIIGADVPEGMRLEDRIGLRTLSKLFEMCTPIVMPAVGDYRVRCLPRARPKGGAA